MSKAYRDQYGAKKGNHAKAFCAQVFPVDENGLPAYITEQGHQKECDVNNIIKKYDTTGIISHVNNIQAIYADVSEIEFRSSLAKMEEIKGKFMQLPSELRKRFDHEPEKLLGFLDNPNNRNEAVELGLIPNNRPQIKPEASQLQTPTPTPLDKK